MWLPLVGFTPMAFYSSGNNYAALLSIQESRNGKVRFMQANVDRIFMYRVLSVEARLSPLATYGFKFEIKFTTNTPLWWASYLPVLLVRDVGEQRNGVFVRAFVFGNNPVFLDYKVEAVIQQNKEVFVTTISGTQTREFNQVGREFLSYQNIKDDFI